MGVESQKKQRLQLQIKQSVAILSFFHPKANVLDRKNLKLLRKKILELGKQKEIKVILLKSQNKEVFSAGAFLDELKKAKSKKRLNKIFYSFGNLMLAMLACPKPIIGMLRGKAIGGAVGVLAACDYVLAEKKAQIRLSELSIGIGPLVIEPVLSKKIGKSAFFSLVLDPNSYQNASWMHSVGLVNKVVLEKEIEAQALAFASRLSSFSSFAIKASKKAIWGAIQINLLKKIMKKKAIKNAVLWLKKKKDKNEK